VEEGRIGSSSDLPPVGPAEDEEVSVRKCGARSASLRPERRDVWGRAACVLSHRERNAARKTVFLRITKRN
jgi:hypothetical protein